MSLEIILQYLISFQCFFIISDFSFSYLHSWNYGQLVFCSNSGIVFVFARQGWRATISPRGASAQHTLNLQPDSGAHLALSKAKARCVTGQVDRLKRLLGIPHSSSKCNDLAQKRERCDSAYILRLPRKGMHR